MRRSRKPFTGTPRTRVRIPPPPPFSFASRALEARFFCDQACFVSRNSARGGVLECMCALCRPTEGLCLNNGPMWGVSRGGEKVKIGFSAGGAAFRTEGSPLANVLGRLGNIALNHGDFFLGILFGLPSYRRQGLSILGKTFARGDPLPIRPWCGSKICTHFAASRLRGSLRRA